MGALDGLRVLDLSRFVAGPHCASILSDLGAEVIKVEPLEGEPLRHYPPMAAGVSLNIHSMNRNKLGVSLNLRDPRGQALVRDLAARADVLVENFVPGTLEKMGCGWEALRALNPKLILARISGFGQDGPYADRPFFDSAAQAMSGLMDLTGPPDGPPALMGVFVCDHVAGLQAAIGVLAALRAREQTGLGQVVDISLLESGVSLLMSAIPDQVLNGTTMQRTGARGRTVAPSNAFRAKDGAWVLIMCSGDEMFRRFLVAIGREHLLRDPRLSSNAARVANLSLAESVVEEWASARSAEEIETLLAQAGVPCAKVATIADVVENPQLRHRGFLVEIPQPDGSVVPIQGPAPRLSETPLKSPQRAPRLGEHTESVLQQWLGYGPSELAELKAQGVIQAPTAMH